MKDGSGVSFRPASARLSTIVSAMAGAAVRPGDWMPAACTSPRTTGEGPMTKSLPATALTPANSVMAVASGNFGTMRWAPEMISAKPPPVVS